MDEDGRRLLGLGDEQAPDPDEKIVVDDDEAAAEAALGRRSVAAGSGAVQASTSRSLEPTRLDGNNVNLDTETLSNVDTVLRYQFATQAMNSELTAVRAAFRTN